MMQLAHYFLANEVSVVLLHMSLIEDTFMVPDRKNIIDLQFLLMTIYLSIKHARRMNFSVLSKAFWVAFDSAVIEQVICLP